MTKTINPDVAAFKDDFFKGLSFRECVFGASALLTGVGGILLLHFFLIWILQGQLRFTYGSDI